MHAFSTVNTYALCTATKLVRSAYSSVLALTISTTGVSAVTAGSSNE
jgi:hypothetical protein